jgi:elongation factor Ts
MANVTASMVKELRDRTGVGMGKCKEALDAAAGDMEEAIQILRKSGAASAVKKESRETNEGVIAVAENDKVIALIEVNAETDFVVQNDRFQAFTKMLCQEALVHLPKDADHFAKVTLKDGRTIEEVRSEQIQSLGENIRIRRVTIINKEADHSVGVYSHMGGKIVTVVDIAGAEGLQDFARALGMHVAAEFPEYLTEKDVPEAILAKEVDIARSQVESKPKNIQDKIIEGKLNAFYDQTCFLRQKYIRDPSHSVAQVVEAEGKKLGKSLSVKKFVRWQVSA